MRFPLAIRDRLPVSRSALEVATKKAVLEAETVLKVEVSRLEGLLDVAGDVDKDLAGNQAQGLFRQLYSASSADRDLSNELRSKVLKNAHVAYALKGQAENLIETHLDFLLGDEITISSDSEELLAQVEEIWEDDRNRLDEDHEDLARSLLLEGELILEATLSTIDGHLDLGWMDPIQIEKVLQDARKRDAFLRVSAATSQEKPKLLFILNGLTDQIQIEPIVGTEDGHRYLITEASIDSLGIPRTVSQYVHGLVFYFPWNRPKGGTRGRSELTSVLDAIDAGDELIWSTVDVQNVKRMFLLHVKDRGIQSKAQGREVLARYGLLKPPRNPKVIGTNKDVEINFVQHQAAESESWLAEELGIQVQGAKGFPENWRGRSDVAGGGVRAGEFIPLRRLRRKQRKLLKVFKMILDTSLEFQRRAGITVAEGDFKLVTIEVGGRDKQRGAELLKALSTALTQASAINGVKPELVNSVIVQAIREAGLTVDPDDEGLPPEMADLAADVAAELEQLMSQKNRQDGEGHQDEEERDRSEEAAGGGGRGK